MGEGRHFDNAVAWALARSPEPRQCAHHLALMAIFEVWKLVCVCRGGESLNFNGWLVAPSPIPNQFFAQNRIKSHFRSRGLTKILEHLQCLRSLADAAMPSAVLQEGSVVSVRIHRAKMAMDHRVVVKANASTPNIDFVVFERW